jgi:2-hydroxychromene-2-carboxylate isomerase
MKSVDFLFDYASPWSYLANEVLARRLPGVVVDYVPVYLRGFESFATGVPYGSAKLAYTMTDFQRSARHEGVPIGAPATFPINGIHALRGAVHARRAGLFSAYHEAVFHAAWRDSREISTKEGVLAIAAEVGLAGAAAALEDPEIKAFVREHTDRAVARGVFGVPTFFVEDEMFWGHDRLDYVARAVGVVTA